MCVYVCVVRTGWGVQHHPQLATTNPRCELSEIQYIDPRGYIIPLEIQQRHEKVCVGCGPEWRGAPGGSNVVTLTISAALEYVSTLVLVCPCNLTHSTHHTTHTAPHTPHTPHTIHACLCRHTGTEQLPRAVALWRCLRQNLSELLDYMYASGDVGKGAKARGGFNWKMLGPSTDGTNTKELLFSQGSGPGGVELGAGVGVVEEEEEEEEEEDVRRGELCQSQYGLGRLASDQGKVLETWFVVHRSKKVVRGHVSQTTTKTRQGRTRSGSMVQFDESTDLLSLEQMASQCVWRPSHCGCVPVCLCLSVLCVVGSVVVSIYWCSCPQALRDAHV